MVGGSEHHTCHQVGVSPQVVDALLCGGAEHLHTLPRGAQQEPAATQTASFTQEHALYRAAASSVLHGVSVI